MLITNKQSKKSWTSPDGRTNIWEVIDQDNNHWQTMSQRIGEGVGQSFDCTTRVSGSGKTYLIQTPKDQQGMPVAPTQSPSSSQVAPDTQTATARFTEAVERFERAISRFEAITDFATTSQTEAPEDRPISDVEAEQAVGLLGGEIVDDLP